VLVLLVAKEMKLVKLGRIALDGTKVKANASRRRCEDRSPRHDEIRA
jgi:hypothetical protein